MKSHLLVLSPNYLQSTACIEQYNIALCCNRQTHRDMLAPFYVETIQNLPTYMKLVQSIECRPQDEDSINSACYQVIVSLSVNFTRTISILNPIVIQYDLFISYSHKDTEVAQKIVKMLQDVNPELKVFFDVLEIKTGKSWQRAMYHSIDGSRCLVALMTNNYIKSAVCQEEFNLAMMKHYAKANGLQLIPFVIDKISCLPAGYEKIPHITTASSSLEDDLGTLSQTLVKWLEKGELTVEESIYHEYFKTSKETKFEISEKWEALRRKHFVEKFPDWPNTSPVLDFPPTLTDTFSHGQSPSLCDDTCDIVLSYHEDDEEYAEFMMSLLQHFASELNIQAKGKNEQERLTRIEEGKKIVPLLSPSYIESPEQVEELHIAIWRSRLSLNLIFPIHLHTLPSRPAYFHLLPCAVSLNDSLWTELALKERVVLSDEVKEVVEGLTKTSEEIALYMAVYYLLESVKQERMEGKPDLTAPLPALLNPFCLDRHIGKSDVDGNGLATNKTNHPGTGICKLHSSPLLSH
ncbi:hypothetical protein HOLleu_18602 [Holothuria leucospilota]|uniref:TIR domain-containing protein n=1 Tax=Holothuria leucospilota TaxID=206669 RepID=A0A9Q1HA03_HOLLE|nr:hypothetical protein HOLleu_18602 [Holothuria leucospilota]